jgi:DNA repair photolyase
MSETGARVSFTITTADDELASDLEPGAPSPTVRFLAMAELAEAGVETGVMIMPVLPFVEDTPENLRAILSRAAESGATTALPWFGVTLRDRQREYFFSRLDDCFAGLSDRYRSVFGSSYFCESPHAKSLKEEFRKLCDELGLSTRIDPFEKEPPEQLGLFEAGAESSG